ncbi:MAG: DUF1559 domain-containing protein, partial [Planctomycetota bacterium]
DARVLALCGDRRGFTVIELLIVISVITVLIAVTLPAVQQVRESSRRMTCQNNIRQIALACDNFETSHKHYPASRLFDPYGIGPDSTAWIFFLNCFRTSINPRSTTRAEFPIRRSERVGSRM